MEQAAPSSYQGISFPLNMLLDELQEKVLFHLPTDDAIQYQIVHKKWKMGIKAWTSCTPMDYTPHPQKPYYFMFNTEAPYVGTYAYNSDKKNWVHFEILDSDQETSLLPFDLPLFSRNYFYISASRGLVCFMNYTSQDNIFICNPIIKSHIRMLPKASSAIADYCAVALSTDVNSRKYVIALVRSSRMHEIWFKHNVTIQLYRSETDSWISLHSENSFGWRGGDTCVICKGVLYSVAQFSYVIGETKPYHAIIAYNLSQEKQKWWSLTRTMVWVPCALTCVRLLNLNDKLTMVGGIQSQGTIELETIGIWEIYANEWKEITRAPNDIMEHFRKKIDETFIASGCGNLIFIQAYTSRTLLTYDFYDEVWTFVPKPPLRLSKDDSNYFGGFCFEPRLDIVP